MKNIPLFKPPIKTKYHNKKSGGYDSKAEERRAHELKLMERAGAIFDLKEQVPFVLVPKQNGEQPVRYVADFVYFSDPSMAPEFLVAEDVKGAKTREYVIKRKLMLHVHGIRIKEVA